MNDLQKVLVVDSGDRNASDALSVELAELGYSSVTASVEAACEVLELIQRPSAIFLKMPQPRQEADYQQFLSLADNLRERESTAAIPLIMWDRTSGATQGGLSAFIENGFVPQTL